MLPILKQRYTESGNTHGIHRSRCHCRSSAAYASSRPLRTSSLQGHSIASTSCHRGHLGTHTRTEPRSCHLKRQRALCAAGSSFPFPTSLSRSLQCLPYQRGRTIGCAKHCQACRLARSPWGFWHSLVTMRASHDTTHWPFQRS